ncbi:MAG: trehalose-phosphatase [Candidatus Omnitrophota bacterium]|nr:MAG: trehalose-phosphatase [Candidatus Omnitrophota bacterium]
MKHLIDYWDKVSRLLKNNYIFLFLDYDGTLTPIAETPEKASLPLNTRELLMKMAESPRFKLAIITGRALENIKKMIGVKGVIYAGNHGLEIEGPKIKFSCPVVMQSKLVIQKIKKDLVSRLSAIRGVIVEDKILTLSIHFRRAETGEQRKIKKIINEVSRSYAIKKMVRITSGKKVFEVRPYLDWDKGKVVLWLFARQQFITGVKKCLPVYIGDDITDEDAFRMLKDKGLTILVGRPRGTHAQYYLKNTKEVFNFLEQISEIHRG